MTIHDHCPRLVTICDPDILREAFNHIADHTRADEYPSEPINRFRHHLSDRLQTLATELRTGTFHPDQYTAVTIETRSKTRHLHIPSVRDRVIERSLVQLLTPWVDPLVSDAAHGYRPGLGVKTASSELAALRDQGFRWIVRSDFADCFETITPDQARARIDFLLHDPALADLITQLFTRRVVGSQPLTGLAQGSPLSPMLANLVMTDFDEALLTQGIPLIRYADDFALAARTQSEAETALRCARTAATDIGMTLNDDKTEITTFDEGFCFLGEDFGPRLPVVDDHPAPVKTSTLYVTHQGSRIRTQAGRLIVDGPNGDQLATLPSGHISRIVTLGAVSISAGVRSWSLYRGVEEVHLSRRGTYLGRTVPATAPRGDRLRAQVHTSEDPDRCVELGRALLDAKLRKQRVCLLRLNRRTSADTIKAGIDTITHALNDLNTSSNPAELMGHEGAAAAAYFRALYVAVPTGLGYCGLRTRRPPQDILNAALSFGYALLTAEAAGALASVGLEPSLGILHRDYRQRPSLALDLMEEFRPWVVDQAVLALARQHRLRNEHGTDNQGNGIYLTQAGREAVIDAYERRMNTRVKGALPNYAGTIRRHLQRQAERFAAAITNPTQHYSGATWR